LNELTVHFYWVLRIEVSEFTKFWITWILLHAKNDKISLVKWHLYCFICHMALTSVLTVRHVSFLWLPEYTQTPCFAFYNVLLRFFSYLAFKPFLCLRVVFTAVNRNMADGKSDKKTWLNYIIQPFFESSLMPFHSCNCLQQTTRTSISLQNPYENLKSYLSFIMHPTFRNLRKFDVPW
jgi:hypothetical protein